MSRFFASRVFLGCLVLGSAATIAGATSEAVYPFDFAKVDPGAMTAWQGVVPPAYRNQAWIFKFRATVTAVKTTEVGARKYYLGSVCLPDECGGNFVAYLISKGGGEAFGELRSARLGVQFRYFGAPDAGVRAILDHELDAQN